MTNSERVNKFDMEVIELSIECIGSQASAELLYAVYEFLGIQEGQSAETA